MTIKSLAPTGRVRSNYMDQLKGFAIILVVVGHVIQYYTVDFKNNVIFSAIYSFHMPLFFFLSGCVSENGRSINSIAELLVGILRKAVALLLPMFIWPLIVAVFVLGDEASTRKFFEVALLQLVSPSLWFLHTLFFIFVLTILINYLVGIFNFRDFIFRNFLIVLTILALMVSSKLLPNFSINSFVLNYGFFVLGSCVTRYENIARIYNSKVVFAISAILFLFFASKYDFSMQATGYAKLIKFGASVFATVTFLWLAKNLRLGGYLGRTLQYLGISSLIIYVTHFSLMALTIQKSPIIFGDSSLYMAVEVFALATFWILLSLVIGNLIKFVPVLNLLLYGKQVQSKARFEAPGTV